MQTVVSLYDIKLLNYTLGPCMSYTLKARFFYIIADCFVFSSKKLINIRYFYEGLFCAIIANNPENQSIRGPCVFVYI